MNKAKLLQLVKQFDQFVHQSIENKSESDLRGSQKASQVEIYMAEMQKRLKIRSPVQEEKFEKLLLPMKGLKSFISVKQFMNQLGSESIRRCESPAANHNQKDIKCEYENLRGGYYLEKVEQHLSRKQFKRRPINECFFTELETNPLEVSEYRGWIEGTLSKINQKKEVMFKKKSIVVKGTSVTTKNDLTEKEELFQIQHDCLRQQHRKKYADQFKVVPNIREQCNQQYEDFTKISSLLTGRLRKLLKSNCTRQTTREVSKRPTADRLMHTTNNPRAKRYNKENSKAQSRRVQTAGSARKDEADIWRIQLNQKMKTILNSNSGSTADFN